MATFEDPWNPTLSEIRRWAYEYDVEEPCQAWDLSLMWRGYEELYIELAADENCPNNRFFLSILYRMVGDQVRRGTDNQTEFNLRDFVAKADSFDNKALKSWQTRSMDLLRHPEKFDYDQWCAGGFASEP